MRRLAVIGIIAVLAAMSLVGGCLFLDHHVFYGTRRIEAEYPGFTVRGGEDGWKWQYDHIEVTVPNVAKLEVQLGSSPPVAIEDLTPALVAKYLKETDQHSANTPDSGDSLVVDPDRDIVISGFSTISFRSGIVTRASFGPDPGIHLIHGKERFALPLPQEQFEKTFGRPLRTTAYSKWG